MKKKKKLKNDMNKYRADLFFFENAFQATIIEQIKIIKAPKKYQVTSTVQFNDILYLPTKI